MDGNGKTDGKRSRKPFTPGWAEQLVGIEALPIKKGGKLVKVHKAPSERALIEEQAIAETISDDDDEKPKETEEPQMPVKKVPKAAAIVVSLFYKQRTAHETYALKQQIADICTSITANPEAAILQKNVRSDEYSDYGIKDLFQLLQSRDAQELELAMLSAALVFKDICPSYRIRSDDDDELIESGKQLKKDTQKLRDYELNLLKSYQKLLKLLDDRVTEGLGNVRNPIVSWGLPQQVGMLALQSLCELLKSLYQFNLRSSLLNVIAGRASQPCPEVTSLCCDTLDTILKNDIHCDFSCEFVGIMSKILTVTKQLLPDRLLRCLQSVKLTVHEDKVKALQIRVKSDRKKRKRNQDSIETTMLEANGEAEKLARQRFQGNSLQEIALIYFRILKAKVGFRMLPVALEGLGRITHLINLDTVNDLLTNLRGLLSLEPPPPVEVRLLCVHCALATLSGPGQELRVDEDPYLRHLQLILRELPATFSYWPALVECLDYAVLKKRVESHETVTAFVRLLFMNALQHLADVAPVLLAVAHNILLRYPRLRNSLLAKWSTEVQVGQRVVAEDDKMEDLAMKALRGADTAFGRAFAHSAEEEELGDGSWIFTMIKQYPDAKYKKIVDVILRKDIAPLPFKASDAALSAAQITSDCMEALLKSTRSSLHQEDKQGSKLGKGQQQGKGQGKGLDHVKAKNQHQPANKRQRKRK